MYRFFAIYKRPSGRKFKYLKSNIPLPLERQKKQFSNPPYIPQDIFEPRNSKAAQTTCPDRNASEFEKSHATFGGMGQNITWPAPQDMNATPREDMRERTRSYSPSGSQRGENSCLLSL